MSSTPIWTGLESLALALIFAPEPFTTVLGVGLLAYARKKRVEQQQALKNRARPRNSFSDFYHYRVGMIQGSSIAYHVSPARQGQLPLARSTISRLYETREEWEKYRNTLPLRTGVNLTRPHAAQPAGLLKTPFLRYQTMLPARRQTP